jgi:hypothetical protein
LYSRQRRKRVQNMRMMATRKCAMCRFCWDGATLPKVRIFNPD